MSMMFAFLHFCSTTFELQSPLQPNELQAHIHRTLKDNGYRHVPENKQNCDTLCFKPYAENLLYYNSFRPQIWIKSYQRNFFTIVSVTCQLNRHVTFFIYLYIFLAIMFEILMLSFLLSNELSTPLLLAVPLLLIFIIIFLTKTGLKKAFMCIKKTVDGSLS